MIRAARAGPFRLLVAEVVRHMIHDKSIEADVPLLTNHVEACSFRDMSHMLLLVLTFIHLDTANL